MEVLRNSLIVIYQNRFSKTFKRYRVDLLGTSPDSNGVIQILYLEVAQCIRPTIAENLRDNHDIQSHILDWQVIKNIFLGVLFILAKQRVRTTLSPVKPILKNAQTTRSWNFLQWSLFVVSSRCFCEERLTLDTSAVRTTYEDLLTFSASSNSFSNFFKTLGLTSENIKKTAIVLIIVASS